VQVGRWALLYKQFGCLMRLIGIASLFVNTLLCSQSFLYQNQLLRSLLFLVYQIDESRTALIEDIQ